MSIQNTTQKTPIVDKGLDAQTIKKLSVRQTSWMYQLDIPAGCTSWMDQLDSSAGGISWMDQPDGSAGQISWTDQLDGSVLFI